jgi:hypothetical protein
MFLRSHQKSTKTLRRVTFHQKSAEVLQAVSFHQKSNKVLRGVTFTGYTIEKTVILMRLP